MYDLNGEKMEDISGVRKKYKDLGICVKRQFINILLLAVDCEQSLLQALQERFSLSFI